MLTAAEVTALDAGTFKGAAIDITDGYIHLSTASQLTETVARHFSGKDNLTIAAVDLAELGDAVRWEESRHGQLFPHLYGPLKSTAVIACCALQWDEQGNVRLPLGSRLGA